MATEYDSSTIQRHADQLTRQATIVGAVYSLIGGLLGVPVGIALDLALEGGSSVSIVHVAVALLVGSAVGYALSRNRAAALRLQAQTALCQMMIEQNTRKGSG